MSLTSKNINTGHLQGIMVGDVFSPRENIAIVTLKVKSTSGDKPSDKQRHFIQLAAFDEIAEEFRRNGADGRVVYVQFFLTTNSKKDKNGVSQFFNNRTVEKVVFGPVIGKEEISVPYLNKGFLQGTVAGVKRIYGSDEGLWSLMIAEGLLHNDSGREIKHYHRFVLKQDNMKFLLGRKNVGENVLVEYRIESRKVEKDGETEHFTDYVLTSLA